MQGSARLSKCRQKGVNLHANSCFPFPLLLFYHFRKIPSSGLGTVSVPFVTAIFAHEMIVFLAPFHLLPASFNTLVSAIVRSFNQKAAIPADTIAH